MELTYIESLRRRWAVLGIGAANPGLGDSPAAHDESEETRRRVMEGAIVVAVIENAVRGEICLSAKEGGTGTNYSIALPSIKLFTSLQSLILSFPAPEALRSTLLDAVHSRLSNAMPDSGAAQFLLATCDIPKSIEKADVIDHFRKANESILKTLKRSAKETRNLPTSSRSNVIMRRELAELYADWVGEWTVKLEDVDLVRGCTTSRRRTAIYY